VEISQDDALDATLPAWLKLIGVQTIFYTVFAIWGGGSFGLLLEPAGVLAALIVLMRTANWFVALAMLAYAVGMVLLTILWMITTAIQSDHWILEVMKDIENAKHLAEFAYVYVFEAGWNNLIYTRATRTVK
jgi:hypothetical protein